MNISKAEQRTLHVLARGGAIFVEKNEKGKAVKVNCTSTEGWTLSDCTLAVFFRLKRRRMIFSVNSGPYRATLKGRQCVRAQSDNRC